MDDQKQLLQKFVDTASDLAESVKRNIQHDGAIDDETVLKLNAFIIASNAIADMIELIELDENETNGTLN